jgi:uncharacterized membrane protein
MSGLALVLWLGCTAAPVEDSADACRPDTDGAYPTWTNFGQAFFDSYCQSCHAAASPNRFGAPEQVSFDDETDVIDQADRIRVVAIDAPSMPPGGGVLVEDLAELDLFLACLNPSAGAR